MNPRHDQTIASPALSRGARLTILMVLLLGASLLGGATTSVRASELAYLSLGTTGSGAGSISGADSETSYEVGTLLTLTAMPTAGESRFVQWQGDACDGVTSTTCEFTINSSMTIVAEFTELLFAEAPVEIDGRAVEEDDVVLSVDPTWSLEPDASRYRWYRCDGPGESGVGTIPSDCAPISRATTTTYVVTAGTVGFYLRLMVTATKGEEIATSYSATLGPTTSLSLELTSEPYFDYDLLLQEEEIVVERVTATWWSPQATSVTYRWHRCTTPQTTSPSAEVPEDCAPIAGTSASSTYYRIGSLDQGKYLGILITAGRGSVISTAFIGLNEPVADSVEEEPEIISARFLNIYGDTAFEPTRTWNNAAIFEVYSDPEESDTLEYSSFPRLTSVSWAWYRCTVEGGATRSPVGCTFQRGGANSSTNFNWSSSDWYYFRAADVGYYIRARIEISNGYGTDYIFTATTEQISGPAEAAPSISVDPSITDVPWEGQDVAKTWGTFSRGYPLATAAYSWYACTLEGAALDEVPEDCQLRRRSFYYTPTSADVGKYLRIRLDLSNDLGDVSRVSATSEAVQTVIGPPTPNGYPQLCYETITGYGGQRFRMAFATGGPPSACGSAVAGRPHYGNGISWESSTRILAQSFGWWLCSSAQPAGNERGDCRLVNTRTGYEWSNYLVRSSDVGRYIRLSTTALNRYGKTTVFSRSYLIKAAPTYQPARLLFFPRVLEDPVVGLPLWQDGGAWQAYGGMPGYYARVQSYRVLWLACTSEGAEVREIPSDCTAVGESTASGGETPASEYVPRPSDVGYYLRVAITANSVGGPSTAVSATTAIIEEPEAVAPTALEDPAIFLEDEGGTRYFTAQIEWDGYPLPATSTIRWYRCSGAAGGVVNSVPESCTAIVSANALEYDVIAGDVGTRLRVAFTASTSSGTTTIVSATSDVVPPLPTQVPAVVSPPLVSGLAMVSLRLIGTTGSWTAIPPSMSYTYRWYSCPSGGAASGTLPDGCVGLNAYSLGYSPTTDDRTKHIRLAVTATNSAGSTTYWSAATAAVVSLSTRAPIASGPPCPDSSETLLLVGTVLSQGACAVSWSAYPAIVGSSSSWWSCVDADTDRTGNSTPAGCRRVKSNRPQYSSSYTTAASDLGRYIRLAITATNRAGKGTVWSATLGPIVETPPEVKPIILFAPELYDTPEVGEWFWQDGGAWIEYGDDNYPPISNYSVEWLKCTVEGTDSETRPADCVAATGITSDVPGPRSAYQPAVSDVGWHIRAGITASSRAGSTTWYSATSVEVPEPPRTAPELVSIPEQQMYSTSEGFAAIFNGTWSGYPAIGPIQVRAYRCTGNFEVQTSMTPTNCTAIGSWQTYPTNYWGYETVAADTGMRIRIGLRVENSEGVAYWFSETSPIVPDLSPINVGGAGAPLVSATVGSSNSLSAWGGSWSGYPSPELTYAWYSCSGGGSDTPTTRPSNCTVISGATTDTLVPQNLGGRHIRVAVTGTNSRGASTRVSAAYGPIPTSPRVSSNPSISGSARLDQTLTANTGSWTGTPTFTYQWFRCTRSGRDNPSRTPSGCSPISDATLNTYEIQSSDRSRFLRVRITATNISGSATIFSQSTSIVLR